MPKENNTDKWISNDILAIQNSSSFKNGNIW